MKVQVLLSTRMMDGTTPYYFDLEEWDDLAIDDGLLYIKDKSGYQFIFPWELVSLVSQELPKETTSDTNT